jgi:fucose permease
MVAAAHVAFVLTGAVTTLLGPLLPVLAGRWGLDDASAGLLFAAQFVGSMAGVACSGPLVARAGFVRASMTGQAAMAAGVGALAFAPWPPALLAVAGYGIGLGITIPATNLLVADAAGPRRSAAVNLLNLAWGLGAVITPPLVAWLAARSSVDTFLLALAGALAVVAAWHARSGARAATPANGPGRSGPPPPMAWRSAAFLTYAALFYIYVGTENGLAGWIAAFAHRLDASAVATATPAIFWTGLLAGRAAAPWLLRRYAEPRLVQAALALAAAGTLVVVTATALPALAAGTALCGIGLSIVFPTTIAQLSRRFEPASARAAAGAFAMAGLGGATLPWLVGVASTSAGSLRAGLLVPLGGCLVMMALHGYRAREEQAGNRMP